jgi:hypothetical protein
MPTSTKKKLTKAQQEAVRLAARARAHAWRQAKIKKFGIVKWRKREAARKMAAARAAGILPKPPAKFPPA